MRVRFLTSIAGASWGYHEGQVIEVASLGGEFATWQSRGYLEVLPAEPPLGEPSPAPQTTTPAQNPRQGRRRPLPRFGAGRSFVCLGGGPSLSQADVDACRGRVVTIAINDAYRLAPWAEVLYACDPKWWRWHEGAPGFAGLKVALAPADPNGFAAFPAGLIALDNTGEAGLERKRTGLRHGRNSGYQAINLAVHLGARRILLLGYDMQYGEGNRSHWFGEHRDQVKPPVHTFAPKFATLTAPLARAGVTVINCSRETALTCFPRATLEAALADD